MVLHKSAVKVALKSLTLLIGIERVAVQPLSTVTVKLVEVTVTVYGLPNEVKSVADGPLCPLLQV